MPAHSSGAASVEGDALGDRRTKFSVDHDVGGVAALGAVPSRSFGAVGIDVALEAVLLVAGRQLAHSPQEFDHAADTDRGRRPGGG